MYSIAFIHPDLGIGGAERLIVELALSLKSNGHKIKIFTSHHDPKHCFSETINGELSVITAGDWLPRSTFGSFMAFWAYLRMIYLTIYVICYYRNFNLIICDQIPCGIPLLKLFNYKCLFYCHFPDQLLTQRKSLMKKIYRYPIDFIEEFSISFADLILVNSKFTQQIFYDTFKSLKNVRTKVLYPCIKFETLTSAVKTMNESQNDSIYFLSINRYERKKNIGLAIKALKILYDRLNFTAEIDRNKINLIIAGGYDLNNKENIEYKNELEQLAVELNIEKNVKFLKNIDQESKEKYIMNSSAIIYTPENEHFGIVPIEAMYLYCPVIAANSGGPKETIIDNVTGYLCEPNSPSSFADAMYRFYIDKNLKYSMSKKCHDHIVQNFNYDKFKNDLNKIVIDLIET